MKKLNIGCGDHPLPGWINSDVVPYPGVLYLDATKRFPFANGEIDRIFSEHAIEHMHHSGGDNMLMESFRVLRPGGRIRISMPTLDFLGRICVNPWPIDQDYIAWACREFMPDAPICAEQVANYFPQMFGHKFVWSQTLLRDTMKVIGFVNPVEFAVSESTDLEFANLENVSRMPPGFLQVETYTLEAEKPA